MSVRKLYNPENVALQGSNVINLVGHLNNNIIIEDNQENNEIDE